MKTNRFLQGFLALGGKIRSGMSALSESRITVIRESRPRNVGNPADVLDSRHTEVAYSAGRANRYNSLFGGALNNPDTVLQTAGGGNPAFYDGILLRHPYAAGILDQKIERANKERIIVPGDPSDERSTAIADEARRLWRKVADRPVVLSRWLRNADFVGYGGVEKIFTRDASTGLVYVHRLIDRKCENIKFRDDGTALWVPGYSLTPEVIPQRKMMFLRTGSVNTPYGDGNGRYIYPATYLIEKTFELMLDSIEEFGRPIPVVYMPRAAEVLKATERAEIRAYAAAVHSRFLEVPTNEATARIDMGGSGNIAASGAIGRPEMMVIEALVTWIYVRMIRVAQTMNKTGGSRALEDTRYDITDDASRPLCVQLDSGLNAHSVPGDDYTGWMADFNDFNFPNEPEEILPRFETPTLSQEHIDAIHERTMAAIDRGIGGDLSKDFYFRTTGMEKAKNDDDRLGGVPLTRFTKTESVVEESSRIPDMEEPRSIRDVVDQVNALSSRLDAQTNEGRYVSIPTEQGKVIRAHEGDSVMTRRGKVALSELVTGDELVTLKG
jgi:hypothetical protein